jgi:tetratricopeptide (TPR) repeat protein
MGWRFRRSVRITKGVRLNFSKRGMGISVGGKGFHAGVGPRGPYSSVGIPGTGLYAINYLGKQKRSASHPSSSQTAAPVQQIVFPPELLNKTAGWAVFTAIVSLILLFIWWPAGLIGFAMLIYWQVQVGKSPNGQARKCYNEGITAVKQGNKKQAIEAFSKVVELKPDVPSIYHLLADLHLGENDHEQAVADLKKCLDYEPENVSLKFKYAWALECAEKYNEALPILQNLPEELKNELSFIIALGNCFLELKQPELALAILENGPTRKRTMDDQMKLFRYLLGMTYKALGQKKKAINELNKVYAIDMSYADIKEQLKIVSEQ